MNEQIVYISGGISGIPDRNRTAFYRAAGIIKRLGYKVVNPVALDDGDGEQSYSYYLRRDLTLLLGCDAIAFLPNWQRSRGAVVEYQVAKAIGLEMFDAYTMEPLEEPIAIH